MAEIYDLGLQQHRIKMDDQFFENKLIAVTGDTARRLEVQLLDSNGLVQDTTGLKLRLNAEIDGKATYTEATVVNASEGLYRVDMSNGMLLAPGEWNFQWQIVDSDGKKLNSFPFKGTIGINISEGGSQAINFYLDSEELKQMQSEVKGLVVELENKLDFPILEGSKSKNIFNKYNVINNKIIDTNTGDLKDFEGFSVGDYEEIEGGKTYVGNGTTQVVAHFFSSRSKDTLISNLTLANNNPFVAPTAEKLFVRLRMQTANVPTFQLELGTKSTPYEEPNTFLKPGSVRDKTFESRTLADDVKLKIYPFATSSLPNPSLIKGVLDLKLFGADPNKKYTIGVFRKNTATGQNDILIHEWVNNTFGNVVCSYRFVGSQPDDIRKITLIEQNGSGITGEITVDRSKIPDGTNLQSQSYLMNGVHPLTCTEVETVKKETKSKLSYNNMPKYFERENEIKNVPELLSNMYFSGRWFPNSVGSVDYMATSQEGQEIYFKVKNTAQITVNVIDQSPTATPATLAVKIDNSEWVRHTVDVTRTPTQIVIASGLDPYEHYIRIMVAAKTDQMFDGSELINIGVAELDEGGYSVPIDRENRIGLFLGDSITAGKDLIAVGTHAAELNYVSISSESLNSKPLRDAVSGIGLIREKDGRTLIVDIDKLKSDLDYDGAKEVDFIVNNIGHNDFAIGATDIEFKNAYQTFIDRQKRKYPGVPIFCMIPFKQFYANTIREIVSENSESTIIIETEGWGVTYTDGNHPNENGSITAGNKLAEFLFSYFGKEYFLK